MLNTVNKLCLFVSFIIQNAIIKRPTIFNWLGIKFLAFKNNKLALLWGEAQLCLPYVCLKKEK